MSLIDTVRQTRAYRNHISPPLRALRARSRQIHEQIYHSLGFESVHARWQKGRNWGDALNPYLIRAISGRRVWFSEDPSVEKYMVIGSIAHRCDSNTIIWGTGCVSPERQITRRPKKVCAVRGPLTRELLLDRGIEVPEVYGDPALLMPRFYDPQVEVRYEVGIVPHLVDRQNPWLRRYESDAAVSIIDVEGGLHSFVRKVKQCRHIVSSSLHGLICADAYGVPGTWVEFSDEVIGGGFKFHDYFASIQRTEYDRVRINEATTLSQIMSKHVPYEITIDLDVLYGACPLPH
ncbi:MAG: polysaccharide pyruvyl transferase family protein [Armatimonadota bacterium]